MGSSVEESQEVFSWVQGGSRQDGGWDFPIYCACCPRAENEGRVLVDQAGRAEPWPGPLHATPSSRPSRWPTWSDYDL